MLNRFFFCTSGALVLSGLVCSFSWAGVNPTQCDILRDERNIAALRASAMPELEGSDSVQEAIKQEAKILGLDASSIEGKIDAARSLGKKYQRKLSDHHPVVVYDELLKELNVDTQARLDMTRDAVMFAYQAAQLIRGLFGHPAYTSLFPQKIEYWRYLERLVTFVEYIHESVNIDPSREQANCIMGCSNHSHCGNTCNSRTAEMVSRMYVYYAEAVLDLTQQLLEHFYHDRTMDRRQFELASVGATRSAPLALFELGALDVVVRVYCSSVGDRFNAQGYGSRLLGLRETLGATLESVVHGYVPVPNELVQKVVEFYGQQGYAAPVRPILAGGSSGEPAGSIDSLKRAADDIFSDTYNFLAQFIVEWTRPVEVRTEIPEHYTVPVDYQVPYQATESVYDGTRRVEVPNPDYCRRSAYCRNTDSRTIWVDRPNYRTVEVTRYRTETRQESRTRIRVVTSQVPSGFPLVGPLMYNSYESTAFRRDLRRNATPHVQSEATQGVSRSCCSGEGSQ